MKLVIKRNLLPNKLIAEEGTVHAGLLVFQGRLPRYRKFTVFIPVYIENGELIHNFRFDF